MRCLLTLLTRSPANYPVLSWTLAAEIEIVIGREALRGCEGDFSVFEHLLEQTVRALQTQTSPVGGDGTRT